MGNCAQNHTQALRGIETILVQKAFMFALLKLKITPKPFGALKPWRASA